MSKVRLHLLQNGRQVAIDEDTGEVIGEPGIDGQLIYVKRIEKRSEGWIQFEQEGLLTLCDAKLTGIEMRVLLCLLAHLQYENWVDISLVKVSEILLIAPSTVSRAIKILGELGFVVRTSDRFNTARLRVSAALCWKGGIAKAKKQLSNEISQT